jgi:hypothetical protein
VTCGNALPPFTGGGDRAGKPVKSQPEGDRGQASHTPSPPRRAWLQTTLSWPTFNKLGSSEPHPITASKSMAADHALLAHIQQVGGQVVQTDIFACRRGFAQQRSQLPNDDSFDDNREDCGPPNYNPYSPNMYLSCLATAPACSWQCGGQGRAVVSWWNGYRRAGGHRLFTANDREPTGIARFPSGVRDSQSDCRTMRNRQ